MTQTPVPSSPDTTLEILDRQLHMLKELGEVGMVVARSQAHAAVAAAHAVEVILADEHWQPETGRARALAGSRHAADAYQAAARSLRLTLMLEKATALTLGDVRAGVVVVNEAVEMRAAQSRSVSEDLDDDGPPADAEPRAERASFERGEFERADRLPAAGFRVTVNGLREEVGARADWAEWSIHRRPIDFQSLESNPPDPDGGRPPPGYRPGKMPIPRARDGVLMPRPELSSP